MTTPNEQAAINQAAYEDRLRREGAIAALSDVRKSIANLQNPYPKSVFTEPTPQETMDYVKLLEEHRFSSDAIHGTWGRYVWELAKAKMLEELEAIGVVGSLLPQDPKPSLREVELPSASTPAKSSDTEAHDGGCK
jgi:hypothetical protein